MELTGSTPHELLTMDTLEQELTMRAAANLEEWRWEQFAKMMGAK
jgi:hypothetical protein